RCVCDVENEPRSVVRLGYERERRRVLLEGGVVARAEQLERRPFRKRRPTAGHARKERSCAGGAVQKIGVRRALTQEEADGLVCSEPARRVQEGDRIWRLRREEEDDRRARRRCLEDGRVALS